MPTSSPTSKHWVVTGAAKGIGLHLIQQLLQAGQQVTVLARNIKQRDSLAALKKDFTEQLRLIETDVTNASQISQAAAQLSGQTVDILINNAGILLDGRAALDEVDFEAIKKSFEVNTIGPMRVTQALMPNLKQTPHPKVINISSQMGSIEDNSSGSAYAYRMSKTALNMFTKNLAMEQPEWTVLCLHPGWVQTDMGGSRATLPPEESAKGLLEVINKAAPEQSGQFFNYKGQELPW